MDLTICIVVTLVILVIYLLTCYRKDCCVDNIEYGTVPREYMDALQKNMSPDVVGYFDDIVGFLPCPASNMSRETVAELKHLQFKCNSATAAQRDMARRYDCSPTEHILDYLKGAGCEVDIVDVGVRLGKLSTICMLIKLHYNRARPFQLGNALGIPIYPIQTANANTPSYISEHTCQAYYLAWTLGNLYPAHKDAIVSIAEDVRNSREYGGWQFSSDNVGAILVARYLVGKL